MQVEQIYTGCLAQGAYYIESNGEAAIIDPLRETDAYQERAARDGAVIKYVFETHFHADFVSGHIDLSKKTGATIVYGPTAQCGFDCHTATDGEVFRVGNVSIKLLHTPGHTMESSCYLLKDKSGKDHAIFTGDTLFLGDVGRPDLAQKAGNVTSEDLAGLLYDSLHTKIMPLADDVIVYPGHGAGSACGKNMMKETVDILGHQKQFNYALLAKDKADFVVKVLDGLTAPPSYFPQNVIMNKQGYKSFENVLQDGMRPLLPDAFEKLAEDAEVIVLDTRVAKKFAKGYIPGSINIGLDGQFAPWVGALITNTMHPILLVTEKGMEEETVTRLARVGYDNCLGHLDGGFEAWKNAGKETDAVQTISAQAFAAILEPGETVVIDVRREPEYMAEHVADSYNKPLDDINRWINTVNPKEHFYLHCAGGYRSMIAASILQSRGFRNFTEVEGGFTAIAQTAAPKTNFVCQSKLLYSLPNKTVHDVA
ncbi:MAG: MBL fold metallo-hydrolase [Bacteroidota bacterium]